MSKISPQESKKIIDKVSKSFCAAKWYNVSMWLGNGRTASCHHPLAHPIPKAELAKNKTALHNTDFKKKVRKEMLEGKRPPECSYCWVAEDAAKKDGTGVFSDRVFQTSRYTKSEIDAIKKMPWDKNVNPKTVEICFDNLCNLACSYCNSEFSSTWAKDVKKNGPYLNMKTGGGHAYSSDGSNAMPFGPKNEGNIYIDKFFEWFKELRHDLQEMRVSGGEPARSPHFWKFLDMCENDTFDFAINSNLIMPEDRLNKLIKSADKFKAMDIYTSAECLGKHQAFVRDGFDWDLWEKNLRTAYESKAFRALHIMMTISVLSVFGVSDFLKKIIEFRKEYNDKKAFNMSVNILRFPSFQSINMLHSDIKRKLAQELEDTINENSDWMQGHEINNFKRLVIYLRKVDVSYEDSDAYDKKQNDLKNFLEQYAIRREKPIKEYMPENFVNWYEQI